jgi:uncharacterized OsmC-like protein
MPAALNSFEARAACGLGRSQACDLKRGGYRPTPTELFVASLAACVAFYGRRFLARHDLEAAGLRVDCRATMSTDRPARVASVTLDIAGVPELSDNRRKALLAVVDHCTVHNSLRTPPEVRVTLAEPAGTDTRPMLAALDG